MITRTALIGLLLALCCITPRTAKADEGMWLFENPPTERIRRATGVRLTDEWLEHVRKASLRFDSGGSGSFVGPNGLAVTNHPVVRGALVRLSTPQRDIQTNGYLARSKSDELPMKDLTVRALWEVIDVTDRVKQASANMEATDAADARTRMIATIEGEQKDRDGLESEVVTLYNGGRYHLYRYKRWYDVRLVWAPEGAIAHFGGDTDNFRYPRFCLDAAIVRVYDEEGNAVQPEHFLEFTEEGVTDDQPTFVSGHPGSTRRLLSVDHFRFLRDHIWPMQLNYAFRRQVELERFANEDPKNAPLIRRDLPGIKNWRKAVDDRLRALQTAPLLAKKQRLENVFRTRVNGDPEIGDGVQSAYADISKARSIYKDFYREHFVLDRVALNRSDLYRIARLLVERARELESPSGERLIEYSDARLPEIERSIMTETPIEPRLERHRVATWLALFAETFGAEHPLVSQAVGSISTGARADELVNGTRLADPEFREELMTMDAQTLATIDDPMLRLAHTLAPETQALVERYNDEVVALEREAYDTIASARFLVFGDRDYPDATFSLRLSFGRVGGYVDGNTAVPPITTAAGLWRRYELRGPDKPFDLPRRWLDAMDTLPADTPVNFISDQHIIGGNSGSPVIDARARFVGLIFDGNRYSASWGSVYENERARAVSVDARFIAASLRDVYNAGWLVEELSAD